MRAIFTELCFLTGVIAVLAVRSWACDPGACKQGTRSQGSVDRSVQQFVREDVDDQDAIKRLFVSGDEAAPSLIRFLADRDKEKRVNAARGLAYIGNQHGLEAVRNAVEHERDKEANAEMCYFLAGALVDTKSQQDLSLLRNWTERPTRIKGDPDDDPASLPAVSASLTLGMMGRKDSLPLLQKIVTLDMLPSEEIKKAIRWIESGHSSGPAMSSASSDEELIKRIVLDGTFFAEGERDHTSVEELIFNRERNRVLVSLEIYFGLKSARGYDLVLAKRNGNWKVVGIWFAWVS